MATNVVEVIADNKQWIFDGIGAVVVASILGVIGYYFKRRIEKKDVQHGGVVVQEGRARTGHVINIGGIGGSVGNVIVGNSETKQHDHIQPKPLDLTLGQIRSDIESVAPYQQKDKKRCYIGQWIDWQTKLHSVDPEDKDGNVAVWLTTANAGSGSPLCHCTVPLDKYPHLKVLPEGAPIRIVGKIESFGITVPIADATLYFGS